MARQVDDQSLVFVRRDMSSGVNTRQDEQVIGETQATKLENVLLDTPGQTTMRTGITLIEDLSTSACTGAFGFEPDGKDNQLVVVHGKKLETNDTPVAASSNFVEAYTALTTGLQTTILKAGESGIGDVFLVSNGTDNWLRFEPSDYTTPQDLGSTDNTGSDSPPISSVAAYFRSRLWVWKDTQLSYSAAYPADYATAFDTQAAGNWYRLSAGAPRAIVPVRDTGMILLGSDEVWGLNPTLVPAATDKVEKILNLGCAAGNTAVAVGDDVLFLANDGVRGVFRTQQDKLQMGQSFPLSYFLKTEFEEINWSQANKFNAIYFDNKYILSLVTGTDTYNNKLWIYYPAFQAWVTVTGMNIGRFAKMTTSGEERLYGVDSNDGLVYRMFSGTTDNGTAIEYTEEGRGEDFGQPLKNKWGGEYKLKVKGGSGTIVVSANPDGAGYVQLGTLDLALTGVSFPTTFPVDFINSKETIEQFHLESLGNFKRVKFKIYCNTSGAVVNIIERECITFLDEYQSED